jgi:tyrosyl-tRNA synthetase
MAELNLIKRNTAEIVEETELLTLLAEKSHPITYCGYEPSGPVHIGTMVAVMKQLDMQKAGITVKVLFADLHALLNRKGDEEFIKEMAGYWRKCFEGLGLTDAEYVLGTDFEYKKEYIQDVLRLGLLTTVNRATRSMAEVARDLENAHVSQMIYPLMQIADIKHMEVDIAHGGIEQRKIHMLARELLPEIGYKKPICLHTPLLCSLQGPSCKMSSSKPETMIKVDEQPKEIKDKINKAFCPAEKEGNPILQIYEYILFPKLEKIEIKRPAKFGGDITFNSYSELEAAYLGKTLHAMDLKNTASEKLITILEPVRKKLGVN